MRLHRLEIAGFGPFLDRQTVDFDAFADDGIFLIAGRTGAGKSSILDAVCFGLYGSVPRYEGGEKRLRSDHCEPDDPSEVVVEFSTSAGRFRVTRSPEYLRPAKRGGGLTKQVSAVRLDVFRDGDWSTLAAKEREVGHELDEILQLSREQFLQVILLAQNRFARFLLADSKERQGLLRRLFGTERFEDVQARFDERRRASEHALAGVVATVDARVAEAERVVTDAELWGDAGAGHEGASTQERIDALRAAITRAEYRAERRGAERDETETRLTAADAALTAAHDEQKAQRERDRARAAMAQLDAEEPEIERAKTELQRARAAEALRATLTAATRAASALDDAQTGEADARERWDSSGITLGDLTPEALTSWAADRIRESGAWARVAELEDAADARAADLEAVRAQVETASALVESRDAERTELPARIAALTTRRDEARRGADRIDECKRALSSATARRDAAATSVTAGGALGDAERSLAAASTALADAQNALAALRRRRLDGIAGELATALVAGEPCTVCGSTEHPSPAEHSDPVSAEDIEAAEAVRDAAQATERTVRDRVTSLTADLAAAAARAEGRTVEAADAEVEAASRAHADAVAAAGEFADLDAEIEQAALALTALDEKRTEAAAALATAREQLAAVAQREQDATAQIAAARGAFESVAARVAAVVDQARTAQTLAAAMTERARAEAAVTAAAQEQEEALAASDFDDATAADAAMRSLPDQEALDARITAHRVQREKERSTLLELELRTLPEEPIDLAPVEAAALEARTAWKTAMDAAGRAETVAAQLERLVASAASEHTRNAERQAEHEILRGLADTIAGRAGNTHKMTLETFVLAAELEEIVTAANRRLSEMSTGRYQLQHSDALAARGAASGLGIVVFDAFTGQTRPAQSLSGGETFLSSLALALGLAEVVTARAGGIQLDTLFIDEGFGSLDADTLDVAMRTLDELRSGGRTVGVISHVEAMQEQIPAQLTVRATPEGPSVID
ncbi:AAA family ATPase [Microbacterium pseudoresistens]|uniref:Nuclease SbcCD subunit C n=1 Tax=Microbacterium pseudoresistens TaxID=640634 RepID=A0A7Y9JNC7_9MICO|nr:exonuclease SbcC [Microbacterium pseudoresistens]